MKTGYILLGITGLLVTLGIIGANKYKAVKKMVSTIKPVELGVCKQVDGINVLPFVFEIKNDSSNDITIDRPTIVMVNNIGVMIAKVSPVSQPITVKAKSNLRFPVDLFVNNQKIIDELCGGRSATLNTAEQMAKINALFLISTTWNRIELDSTFNPLQSLQS